MTTDKVDFEDKKPGFSGLARCVSFTHLTQNGPHIASIQTYFQAQPVGW